MDSKEIIDINAIVSSIPHNFYSRILREVSHALTVNLCVYRGNYVTHTIVHYTSAEASVLDSVVENVRTHLLELGWHVNFAKSDPHFFGIVCRQRFQAGFPAD